MRLKVVELILDLAETCTSDHFYRLLDVAKKVISAFQICCQQVCTRSLKLSMLEIGVWYMLCFRVPHIQSNQPGSSLGCWGPHRQCIVSLLDLGSFTNLVICIYVSKIQIIKLAHTLEIDRCLTCNNQLCFCLNESWKIYVHLGVRFLLDCPVHMLCPIESWHLVFCNNFAISLLKISWYLTKTKCQLFMWHNVYSNNCQLCMFSHHEVVDIRC